MDRSCKAGCAALTPTSCSSEVKQAGCSALPELAEAAEVEKNDFMVRVEAALTNEAGCSALPAMTRAVKAKSNNFRQKGAEEPKCIDGGNTRHAAETQNGLSLTEPDGYVSYI